MREVIQHEPGTFCWPELATTDTDAAGHFYASLFGWAIKRQERGPQAYTELWKGPRPRGRDDGDREGARRDRARVERVLPRGRLRCRRCESEDARSACPPGTR